MDYLVSCPCGHTLDRHDSRGCNARTCACLLTPEVALQSATDVIRKEYGYQPQAVWMLGEAHNLRALRRGTSPRR